MKRLFAALAIFTIIATAANAQVTWSDPIVSGLKFSDLISGDAEYTFEAAEYPGSTSGTGDFFTGSGASTYNTGLNTVLDSHGWNSAGATVVVDGLNVGEDYQIQLLMGDTRGCCLDRTQTASDGTNVSGEFSRNGGSVVGTFTASGDSLSLDIAGAADPGLSGYILWNTTTDSLAKAINFASDGATPSVPEPSGMLLGLAATMGCLAFRRRR